MRKFFVLITLVGGLGLSACASIPFEAVQYQSVEHLDPETVRTEFQASLPEKFEILESVILNYEDHDFFALGVTGIDRKAGSFKVAGLNPMGLKLFEISGDNKGTQASFTFPALKEKRMRDVFSKAMAGDISKIYLNRIPQKGASVHKESDKIVYTQREGEGELEFVFAGEGPVLVEKSFKEAGRVQWRLRYYEYRLADAKWFPGGVILKHQEPPYELTLRLQEIF